MSKTVIWARPDFYDWYTLYIASLRTSGIGVYIIFNDEKILHVGQSKNLKRRFSEQEIAMIISGENRPFYVTWANLPRWDLDGVERFLADHYFRGRSALGHKWPDVEPIAINLPELPFFG